MTLRTIQPNPNKRQHPPTPLGALLNKYAISLASLRDCLHDDGVKLHSRSTLHRLVHGTCSEEMMDHLLTPVARCLTKFLVARGLPKDDIDREMTAIFDKGEYQPIMAANRIELTRAECSYFGLDRDPFTAFPEQKGDVFISPPLQRVIDRVIDALKYPTFLAVTGEIGSGKDVLRAMIEDHVESQGNLHVVWPEFMDQKRITPVHIARAILRHFGYGTAGNDKIPAKIEDLGAAVKNCLKREYDAGSRVTIAFNECHHMNDAALSSLKNFFEMGSGGFVRWMSVLLIGQPSFASTDRADKTETVRGRLYAEKFRELAERIILVEMPKSSEFQAHAADYMRFRLQRSGRRLEDLFDDEALAYLTPQANTPQQLGNLANKALRVSRDVFDNKLVEGSAIKTKMFFENRDTGNWKARSA